MQNKLHNLQGQSSVMATRERGEKAKGAVLRAPCSIYISNSTAMYSSNTGYMMLRLTLSLLLVCVCVGLCSAGGYGKMRRRISYHGYGKPVMHHGGSYGMWQTPSYYDSGYSYGGLSSGYPYGYSQGVSSFGYASSGYAPSVGGGWGSGGYVGSGLNDAISGIGYQSGGYYSQGGYDPYSQGSYSQGSYMY